jgi:hypothetical protein
MLGGVDAMRSDDIFGAARLLPATWGATLSDEEAGATAALFRVLADPARVKIVNLLATSGEPGCAREFELATERAGLHPGRRSPITAGRRRRRNTTDSPPRC